MELSVHWVGSPLLSHVDGACLDDDGTSHWAAFVPCETWCLRSREGARICLQDAVRVEPGLLDVRQNNWKREKSCIQTWIQVSNVTCQLWANYLTLPNLSFTYFRMIMAMRLWKGGNDFLIILENYYHKWFYLLIVFWSDIQVYLELQRSLDQVWIACGLGLS